MSETVRYENISQLVTPTTGVRRGREMRELTVIEDAAMLVRDGVIEWVGPRREAPRHVSSVDLGWVACVPGLIDPHTHAVWGGDRLADFEARCEGRSYEEILRAGGGIRSTMRRTAATPRADLVRDGLERVGTLARNGATTVEVKSGYAADLDGEIELLRAIRDVRAEAPVEVVPTLLLHVPPTEGREAWVADACARVIPLVAAERLAVGVDVFCEAEAFTVDETRRFLEAARAVGLGVKLHADQFHAIGGTEIAVAFGALSVDHLEASGEAQVRALASSGTVATVLPGVSLHLGLPSAPARRLVDVGAAVAVGTDLNPGSSPLFSPALALALAVRLCGLTPAEALVAGTVNAAAALGLTDRGALAPGLRADFLVLSSRDWRDLPYTLGASVVRETYIAGRPLRPTPMEATC